MLGVTVLAVGGLKESYLRQACDEYRKRLRTSCKLDIVEIPEHRLPQEPSPAMIRRGLEQEAAALLAKIPKGACTIALCIEGKAISSEALAETLERVALQASQVVFVIGGSHGLAEAVKQASEQRLSMSPMTFPHQLARVMLLEQIYRAFSINMGTKYHK